MSDARKARILIVDDEAALMKALSATLRDHDYETFGFTSAKSALAELQKQKFDLLLADLMMPEMDGIALLQAALQSDPDLVGIIMTGQGTIDTAVQSMKTGAMDYILKPFKLSEILSVVSRALAVRRLRLENAALNRRLQEHSAKLEIANEELKAYSYSISHDLRAPLRAMGGFADVLEKKLGDQLSPDARHYVTRIQESARRMGKLIDGLLDFSALGWVPVTRTTVHLQKIIQAVLEELRPGFDQRQVDVNIEELPACTADPMLLRQVFTNLLANALKYSRDRDPAVIRVGVRREKNETVYFVQDNGAGFDMEYAGKLFRVFQRLHGADQFEGTGVGLAIVQRIVQRHGGRIWAEAEVDRGATFYFTLGENCDA